MRKTLCWIGLLWVNCVSLAVAEDYLQCPNGYAVAATWDAAKPAVPESGTRIDPVSGKPDVETAIGKALYDAKAVAWMLTGLESKAEYVIAVTWCAPERVQSVYLGTEGGPLQCVLPATPAVSFYEDKPTWSSFLLPVPAAMTEKGAVRLEVRAGNNAGASVNKAWLLRKADATPRKRLLIVTGDDYPGHRWRLTAPEFAGMLREDPSLEVSISESPAILGSPLLRHYDGLLIHFKNYAQRLPLGQEVWQGLQAYVEHGGGIMVAHFGCGAFQEWTGFVNVAGRVWNPAFRAHDPYGPFDVRMVDAQHTITRGMQPFGTQDELYTCLDGTPAIHVLCEATSKVDQKPYPMGFVLEGGNHRLFHCTLGHDVNALKSEGVRGLYRRAARWITGLDS